MRALAIAWLCGCYHPTLAVNVPCASGGECPEGQVCDFSAAPPRCVTSRGDGGTPLDSVAMSDGESADAELIAPIAFVQASTTKPTAVTTTLALPGNVGLHDAIVVCLNYPSASGATLSTITDTLGNTYSVVVGPITAAGNIHYIA